MNKNTIIYGTSIILFLSFISGIRIYFASPFASTWDMVDFSLALDRFDIFMMQPHFPGYPYFIFMGMLIEPLVEEQAKALSIVSALLMTSAAIPVFLILKKRVGTGLAFLGTFFVQSSTYLWIMSTQPMSEASAVAILLWYMWALDVSLETKNFKFAILTSFLFSLLMGIRLSYFPFGIGLLILWWTRWRYTKTLFQPLSEMFLFVLFQSIWIGGLISSTGGISSFIELSLSFTNGHFNEWGGSAVTSDLSLMERFFSLIFMNFLWTGVLGESVVSCILLLIAISLTIFYGRGKVNRWMVVLFGAYFAWAWLGQNIEKPRHILPLVPMTFIFLIQSVGPINSPDVKRTAIILTLVPLMMLQFTQGIIQVKEIHAEPPASYQLTQYLNGQEGRMVVFTWEEERVFDYLKAPFYYKKIYRYHLFQEEINQLRSHRILITDRVLQGFEQQGIDVTPHVTKVETFESNHFVDPIYSEIQLYEWEPTIGTP